MFLSSKIWTSKVKYFLSCSEINAVLKEGRKKYILDDNDQELELDTQGFLWVGRSSDEVCADICAHDLQN
jgi:hypothetical protein